MIPSLETLRRDLHIKVNDIRRIDSIINAEDFSMVWNKCTDDQKLAVVNHVSWTNKTALINMIKKIKSSDLATMTVIQLRLLAKKRGLMAFMQMSKSTLLSELSKLEGLDYDEE